MSRFEEALDEFMEAGPLTRPSKATRLTSQIDILIETKEGLVLLYKHIDSLVENGILDDSPWSDPSKLQPSLVSGTIKSGHPNQTIECISELRMLAIYENHIRYDHFTSEDAESFLQEVMMLNLEFVFGDPLEATRQIMSQKDMQKAFNLFAFISEKIDLNGVKVKLLDELTLLCAQRSVVTEKQRSLIKLIKDKIDFNLSDEVDKQLYTFVQAIYEPTMGSKDRTVSQYKAHLKTLSDSDLRKEAETMGKAMSRYGLVSQYQAALLLHLVGDQKRDEVPLCLGLNSAGLAKWFEEEELVSDLILRVVHPHNAQCIYGLSKMLESGVISRDAVKSGLINLLTIRIHPKVSDRILKSSGNPSKSVSARQYLIGAVFRVLGQPLGIGQGNNPTCQSARGISMWSKHSPAKLINMIHTVAVHNDLKMRFEGQEIVASLVGKGLVDALDHNLDAVSVTLVPMLDRIYNEMMTKAAMRGEDPHKWVNPALYGQWILIGFASAYDYLTNSILDFNTFVKLFYASFHPAYNGGRRMVYPNPIGIFITTAKGEMLGFHAISLLRIDQDPKGEHRAYFLNPNNEGRQNWGQGIVPSVYGNGEMAGESSLPFYQLAARIYAFHYNTMGAKAKLKNVPVHEVNKVKKLAQESWGKSYLWNETKKEW